MNELDKKLHSLCKEYTWERYESCGSKDKTVDEIKSVISNGANPNSVDKPTKGACFEDDNYSCLHIAATWEADIEFCKILINAGADVNQEKIEYLIKGTEVGGSNPLVSESPLHIALDNFELVKLLIDNGADVNRGENHFGSTPLHATKSPEIVDLLVQHGADPLSKNHIGLTPLFAIALGSTDENLLRKHLEYGEMIPEDCRESVYDVARDNINATWSPQIMCELEALLRIEAAKKGIKLYI